MRTKLCVGQEDDGWEPREVSLAREVFVLAPYANAKWRQRAERRTFQFFFEQESMSDKQYALLLARLKDAHKHLRNQLRKFLARTLGTEDPYHRPRLSAWHEQYGKEPARHQGILVPVKRWY